MSTMLLTDKVLLVTGAGRGIGYAIVECAVREGANVIAHVGRSLPSDSSFDKFNSEQVHILTGDLSLADDINGIWADALAWKNRIDVLVNNAGVYLPSLLEPESDWDAGWKENLAINLQAPAALCRHAIKHYQTRNEGIIINMASRSSHRGDDADHLAYGAAKGGLLALTKGIARSYAKNRALAYAIAPAWVRTEMAEAHIASVGEDEITKGLPMREITPASDVAETVVFLASGRARHANGCTIDITGADYVR
jgi:3-oxoacyl-[acyl-carrier protein] reductase